MGYVASIKGRMTPETIKQLSPHASQSFIDQNSSAGIRPVEPEQAPRVPLERVAKRASARTRGGLQRFRITFHVFSVRPLDWDNCHIKEAQDCLVEFGLLPDDNWRILSGEIVSEKAESKDKERTEITIEAL